MILQTLNEKGLIHPPKWLINNTHYLTIMGSQAYGVSTDESDLDYYGCAIPIKEDIFPHLRGEIPGFGTQKQGFGQWQEHHILDKEANREYDFNVYSIVKYMNLLMQNNPNVIDSLFTPQNCVVHSTQIGNLIRDNRREFLHKGSWHKFRGYAFSSLHKLRIKDPKEGSKRAKLIELYGMDTKYAYHIPRLLNEAEQILNTKDIDIQQNKEMGKSIRRGEWTFEQLEQWFTDKERQLSDLYNKSTIPYSPDESKIKQLLLNCLEIQYGNLDKAIIIPDKYKNAIDQIEEIINSVKM